VFGVVAMSAESKLEFIDLKAQYAASKAAIDQRIHAVLDHGQYILGPEVAELEARLAELVGARHCVTVASGTEALLIALMALGIGPGDEVITSPFTFVATAEVIVRLGAKPVFCDIERDTCNMAAAGIEPLITSRTRAVMPVSLYGQPCDMAEINAIAARHELPVVEDAAQSFGASYRGGRSAHLSTLGCTSFFPSKPLGCYGDGGALFTDDDGLAQAAREIRVHGQSDRYQHTRVGVGGRMDTLQCAVLLAKLERFAWEVQQRAAIGKRYDELCDAAAIARVAVRSDRTSVFAQYSIFVQDRERVVARLREAGIPTAIHYPATIPRQPAYAAQARAEDFPNALWAAEQVLALPMHPYLSAAAQERVVSTLSASRDARPPASV
jgi:UDP-2-acetamido-2-deoxy-ribo-hexuluronate aminotransferase